MRKTKSTTSLKNFNTKTFQDLLFTVIIFGIMLIIISNPKRFTSGTISGLKLFFYSVLPGLFPFMLLTKLLTEIGFMFKVTSKFNGFTNKVFGTGGISLYVFFVSILSGYPIGAKTISDLYEKNLISDDEAKKMSIFCTTSGPGFVIATIGISMFSSAKIGIILYVSHIISSLLMGIIFNLLTRKKHTNTTTSSHNTLLLNKNNINIIQKTVSETINSLFVVGAYITIFYLITELFDAFCIISVLSKIISKPLLIFGINQNTTKGLLYGIIEVTRGAKELSKNTSLISVALCSGILSFSGISIIMQSMAFLKPCKIKAHTFFFQKCVHFVLCVFVCYILLIIF